MVSAMCPNCSILLVEASSASYRDLGAAENTAARLGALSIGNSYGGGEAGTTSYNAYYTHPGVNITASAGDSGYGVAFPASSPNVIAVGGTSLVYGSGPRSETAWSGSGSGCSAVYAQPSWQQSSNSNMANNTGCSRRVMNDVSAVADPYTGVAVYGPENARTSAWMVFGGTSVAAPLVGALYGRERRRPPPTLRDQLPLRRVQRRGAQRHYERQQRTLRRHLFLHRRSRLRRPNGTRHAHW